MPARWTAYRFFAVDEFDIVAAVHWIECEIDAAAEETGISLLSQSCDVEVWEVAVWSANAHARSDRPYLISGA